MVLCTLDSRKGVRMSLLNVTEVMKEAKAICISLEVDVRSGSPVRGGDPQRPSNFEYI